MLQSSLQQRADDMDGWRMQRYCWLLDRFYRSERDWGHLASAAPQDGGFGGSFMCRFGPGLGPALCTPLLGRHEETYCTVGECWHPCCPLGPRAVSLEPRDIPTVSSSPDTLSLFGLGSHPHVPGSLGEGGSCNLHESCFLSANDFLDSKTKNDTAD